ncbi:MAG: cadherin-like domain-containing protein, partial [Verrucomicrobiales bacterium]|nr:cadherin-like domain-containing protein [Verrucomicrobiales bacterium]
NNTLTDYTFDITGTPAGGILSVQIYFSALSGGEAATFDNIRITGVEATGAAPAVATIEGSTLGFTEGDAAKQITNTITASDSDSTDLSEAQIQITGNLASGEDVLSVNGALPGGIIADAYVPATGLLRLSGASSVANYQAALRQVQYGNTGGVNPTASTRTVRFFVTDPTAQQSNTVSRDIAVTATIGSGTIPHTESFETDGEGARYLSNTFNDGSNNHFERHNFGSQNPHPFQHETITGVSGNFAWAAERSEFASENPLGDAVGVENVLRLFDLAATGLTGLQVEVALGSSHPVPIAEWETGDYVRIQYAWDADRGSAAAPANPRLLQGTYTTAGQFYGTGVSGDGPRQDADLNGTADPAGAELTEALQEFLFDITGTGSVLSIQVAILHGGNEEIVFDNIRVTGTSPVNPTANPDNIERYPTQSVKVAVATLLANDSDGGSPTNTITGVTASGSGAIVTMSGGNVFYNPNGVTVADTFTYTVENGGGGTDTGTVNVGIITDNDPSLNLTSIEIANPDDDLNRTVTVSFAGIPGRAYRIETSTDLLTWIDTGSTIIADDQGRIVFTDGPPAPPANFYRTVNVPAVIPE